MPLQAAMVLTTINDPAVLDGYYLNFLAHQHLAQVRVIVIPDRKTPDAAYERCEHLRSQGMSIDCPRLLDQECFLRKVGFPADLIPYDSDNRRNVGYLMALTEPIDFLISVDDDNFCPGEEDFFAAHSIVCDEPRKISVVETSAGWFNMCEQLTIEPRGTVYPRGYPHFARHKRQTVREQHYESAVRINAGLWLQEPDLDALTWLNGPVRTTAFCGASVILGDHTWSPVNTHNTALHRSAIPSYYFVKMGFSVSGMRIDRYGDIFSGYFSQACAKSLGDSVRVGTPIATHRRNSHNYLKDATQELACICMLEEFLPWLKEYRLSGTNYLEAYESLSHGLEEASSRSHGFIWTQETARFFSDTAQAMREWVKACRHIGV